MTQRARTGLRRRTPSAPRRIRLLRSCLNHEGLRPAAGIHRPRISRRGADVSVTEQFLHGPDVVVVLQQVRGERMTQGVARRSLRDARPPHRVLHGALKHGLVQVMPAALARLPVDVDARGRKHPLPRPLAAGVRILPGQRPRGAPPSRRRAGDRPRAAS